MLLCGPTGEAEVEAAPIVRSQASRVSEEVARGKGGVIPHSSDPWDVAFNPDATLLQESSHSL